MWVHYVNRQELSSDALVDQDPEQSPLIISIISEVLLDVYTLGLYTLREMWKIWYPLLYRELQNGKQEWEIILRVHYMSWSSFFVIFF